MKPWRAYRIVLGYDYNGDAQGWREKEKTFIRPGVELTEVCRELMADFLEYNHAQNSRNPRVISADELPGEFTCGSLKTPVAPIG